MKAKEFCQKYNLGIDSSWVLRKYGNHDLSLVEWYNLVKEDLTEIPTQLSQAVAEETVVFEGTHQNEDHVPKKPKGK